MELGYQRTVNLCRETNISPDQFYENYFSKERPVILSGNMKSWSALSKWTPDFLKDVYGDIRVHASLNIQSRSEGFKYWGNDVQWIRIAEYVDLLTTSSGPCYTRQAPASLFPNFNSYYNFNNIIPMDGRLAQVGLWFGSKGTDSGLHWDTESNLLAQIYGSKRAILFHPSDIKYLSPYKNQIRWTEFDSFKPDFELHPDAAKATPYFVELLPGDIIHIPRGWWHHFISNETAISINCFFQPSCSLYFFIRSIATAGSESIAHTIKDFIILGILKLDTKTRQLSDIPTGLYLYNIITESISRRARTKKK